MYTIYIHDKQIKSWSYFCKMAYYNICMLNAVRNNLSMHRVNFKPCSFL